MDRLLYLSVPQFPPWSKRIGSTYLIDYMGAELEHAECCAVLLMACSGIRCFPWYKLYVFDLCPQFLTQSSKTLVTF